MQHRSITQNSEADLESRIVKLALSKLLEGVADLPLVDALVALDELIELLTNANLGAAILEEPLVQRFLQVLLRPLRHALAASKLLQRHFYETRGFSRPVLPSTKTLILPKETTMMSDRCPTLQEMNWVLEFGLCYWASPCEPILWT